jgi:hypothetical protein
MRSNSKDAYPVSLLPVILEKEFTMVVSLERNGFERCYLWVLNNTLIIKDQDRAQQEKSFDSNDRAITECQKFVQRRVKNNWQIRSQTDSSFFYQKMLYLEQEAKSARQEKGFDKITCYLLDAHPATSLAIDGLKEITNGLEIPSDYRDFLLTCDGFQLEQKVLKDGWGCDFSLRFVPTYVQKNLQGIRDVITDKVGLTQPFLVISYQGLYHRLNDEDFFGAILLMESHQIKIIDAGVVVCEFDSFLDYFLFELSEVGFNLFNGRYTVERKAN